MAAKKRNKEPLRNITCPECNGSGRCKLCGGTGRETCTRCNGTGKVEDDLTCPVCLGYGSLPCNSCNGSGVCYKCNGTGSIPDQLLTKKEKDFDLLEELRKRSYQVAKVDPATWYFFPELQQNLQEIKFNPIPPTTKPEGIYEMSWVNDTSVPETQRFNGSETVTETHTWNVTKSIHTGIQTTFQVGVPILAGGISVNISLNLSSTESQTKTTTKTWGWDMNVTIPAHKRVTATAVLQQAMYDTPFYVKLRVSGYTELNSFVEVGFGKRFPIGWLFGEGAPGVKVIGPSEIEVETSGRFQAVQGVKLTVETHESPIGSKKAR